MGPGRIIFWLCGNLPDTPDILPKVALIIKYMIMGEIHVIIYIFLNGHEIILINKNFFH